MQQLPEDVLLQVCEWLCIRDILALRRLNQFFHSLTKTPNIWLSLLRRLTLLLPPCQPILDASKHNDVEYYISRSMRFQQNWRRSCNPYPKHYIFSFRCRVNAMVFLPGGNHMVSVHEGNDAQQDLIVVSSLGKRHHAAIAMIRSRTSVNKLQARYALVRGNVSLVIAYVRPPDGGGRTAVVVISAPLAFLSQVLSLGPGTPAYQEFMKHSAEPFESLLEESTRYSVGAMSLSEIDGVPTLGVVYRPRTIALYNLIAKTRFLLKLQAPKDLVNLRHSIWCIKILPSQKQILALRVLIDAEADLLDNNPIVFELYDIPSVVHLGGRILNHDRELHATPVQRRIILGENVESCYISDGDNSWTFNTHADPDAPMLHILPRTPPPPLSIFIVARDKRGFVQFISSPKQYSEKNAEYYYDLPVMAHARYDSWEEQETPMILPGGYHSIVIMRPVFAQPLHGFCVSQLCAYRTGPYEFSDPRDTGYRSSEQKRDSNGVQTDSGVPKTLRLVDENIKYPPLPEELALSMYRGTKCSQFDEWLGRLFVVTSDDPCSIHVLDWSM